MKPNLINSSITKFCLVSIMLVLATSSSYAADTGGDFFTNIGKIYVVVGVILLVFLGLVFFLIRLENRIKKLEDEISKN